MSRLSLPIAFLMLLALPSLASVDAELQNLMEADCKEADPMGFLVLSTKPWTQVKLDGKALGDTPVWREKIPVGPHTLELINAEFGVHDKREIVIESNKTLKLHLFLGWKKIDWLNKNKNNKDEDCAEPIAETVFLTVQAKPWSKVYLDGEYLGATPIYKRAAKPGEHALRLVNEEGEQIITRFHADKGEHIKYVVGQGATKLPK